MPGKSPWKVAAAAAAIALLATGCSGGESDDAKSDTKITYNPSDRTSVFGRYSVEPFSVTDPQELGAAGGGTFDGGHTVSAHKHGGVQADGSQTAAIRR